MPPPQNKFMEPHFQGRTCTCPLVTWPSPPPETCTISETSYPKLALRHRQNIKPMPPTRNAHSRNAPQRFSASRRSATLCAATFPNKNSRPLGFAAWKLLGTV
ncbi:hypothetical protein K504DRAFT_500566 [Pleomassaria siparia CBS 279.74]|uniref:Uncharacterized protein n=1 Tax=Pleomassaria siparia CBS 279.74 TaxID=1314801 RepID=A0A6G1KHN9_9PLEO|nr:hypothetical protein K504DRAFT_500566 [Pleomassaria siparia CBS 279.74]